jgi:hypothetical protein
MSNAVEPFVVEFIDDGRGGTIRVVGELDMAAAGLLSWIGRLSALRAT